MTEVLVPRYMLVPLQGLPSSIHSGLPVTLEATTLKSRSNHRQGRADVASGLSERLLVATKGEVTFLRALPVRQ